MEFPPQSIREADRGKSFGLCAKPECPRRARWIPVSHARTKPDPLEYYCTQCCDEIGEAAHQEWVALHGK